METAGMSTQRHPADYLAVCILADVTAEGQADRAKRHPRGLGNVLHRIPLALACLAIRFLANVPAQAQSYGAQ